MAPLMISGVDIIEFAVGAPDVKAGHQPEQQDHPCADGPGDGGFTAFPDRRPAASG
jgi:hypothetical protein